jgi:ureidoglycolate hydrolase
MRTLRAEPINSRVFAPFGRAVEIPAGPTTSEGPDYKFWSDLAHYQITGETEIGMCTVYERRDAPITAMERHVGTPEILIPIDSPFMLPLLLPESPDVDARAFLVRIGEAVVINEAVWHGACLPVGKPECSYFVIFRRHTPAEDVEKRPVSPFLVQTA